MIYVGRVESNLKAILAFIDQARQTDASLLAFPELTLTGYPLLDLPSDTSVSAIEFRNLADYRMRFRSVVFVNQRAVALFDESPRACDVI